MNKWDYYYPRPLIQRKSFFSLNGKWLLNNKEIEVPFPRESVLSEYQGDLNETTLVYEKDFSLPMRFNKPSDLVILHFGAVDQTCEVYLNDELVATHEGGYLDFEVEISKYLKKDNHLKVICIDTLDKFYPYGKQTKVSNGMWYTQVSGIWQSVWIEAVPKHYVKDITIQTTLDKLIIDIESNSASFMVTIPYGKKQEFKQYYEDKHIEIDLNVIEDKRLWSTNDPYLYPLIIEAGEDKIESYFGIREFKVIDNQLYLNNKRILIKGVLDQGYFKDGIFLPSDPLEYFNDVLRMKELGFNCLRKHIKLEPQAFYYACDKMGMLVMQDMVQSGNWNFFYHAALPTVGLNLNIDNLFYNKKRLDFFIEHSKGIIKRVKSHPCIFSFTIYNEGWGQQCADKVYKILKEENPDYYFDSTSGWFFKRYSDFESYHYYFKNRILKKSKRMLLLSECGGYARNIEEHNDGMTKEYGYASTDSEETLTNKYIEMFEKMIYPSIKNNMMGYIITQLSDVENEINGFYTYDRQICKVDKKKLLELNEKAETI